MKTKAAVLYEPGKGLEIEELDLDGPQSGEILIRYTHAGLCHSDLHLITGDMRGRTPMVLGHEGAGIVEEVGPGVTRVAPGDRVVCSFIPNCGVCRYCATGRQSICDWGAGTLGGSLPGDRFPITGPRGQYGAMCMIGTFSQYGVIHQNSAVKVDGDTPLDKAVLLGCGVPTGWGSVVYSAEVTAGDAATFHSETVGNGCVDLEGFAGDAFLAFGGEAAKGPHIVQAIGELDDDDADIADHREEHLAEALGLAILGGEEVKLGELGDAIDAAGNFGSELLPDILAGDAGVFNHVMQQAGLEAHHVHPHIGQDVGDLDGMRHVGLA